MRLHCNHRLSPSFHNTTSGCRRLPGRPSLPTNVTEANALLHGEKTEAFGNAGYQGADKRPDAKPDVRWNFAMRPGKRRALARLDIEPHEARPILVRVQPSPPSDPGNRPHPKILDGSDDRDAGGAAVSRDARVGEDQSAKVSSIRSTAASRLSKHNEADRRPAIDIDKASQGRTGPPHVYPTMWPYLEAGDHLDVVRLRGDRPDIIGILSTAESPEFLLKPRPEPP